MVATVPGVQRAARIVALARADKEHTEKRGKDTRRTQQQGKDDIRYIVGVKLVTQQHDGHDSGHERVENVGAHARHITHVVTDVVGDHGGVAGIVFIEAELDLAHQVGADVGRLGVDAAAGLGQQGQRAGAKAKAEHNVGVFEQHVDEGHADEGKTDTRRDP